VYLFEISEKLSGVLFARSTIQFFVRFYGHVTIDLEWRKTMKVLRSLVVALTIGAASISAAQAHDSFNIGINVGGYDHYAYPAVAYRAAPQVAYYPAPRVYYPAAYTYYGAPVVVHRDVYYGGPRNHFGGYGYRDDRGYGHHGWHR